MLNAGIGESPAGRRRRRPAARGDRARWTPTAGSTSRADHGPARSPRRDARRPRRRSAELAERLELHRSAVQRALERLERLARQADAADPVRTAVRRRSGMIRPMRPVIVAANWKMHTTPADAGDLARTIARADPRRWRRRGSCARRSSALPRSVPRSRLGRRGPTGRASRSARRTSTTSSPAPTPARSRRRCSPASRHGSIVGHSERRRDDGETDELIGRKLGRRDRRGLRADPVRRRAARRTARPGGPGAVVDRQLRGASRRRTRPPSARCGRPAWSSRTSRSGRSGRGGMRAAPTPPTMADAIRAASRASAGGRMPARTRRSCTAAA